jgi:hypothetical protein
MKKGCAVGLFTWVASAAAYWYFLHSRLQSPADVNVAIAGGLVMMVAIGQFRAAAVWVAEARKVSLDWVSSGSLGERPKDGEAITAVGRIRAVGPPLTAPFSGKPAVLYMYDVKHVRTVGRDVSFVEDYSGFAQTPSVIDSPHGPIRLLGIPLLERFDNERLESESALQNATAWIANTQFVEMTGLVTAFRELKNLTTDDDGQARKDWRINDSPDLRNKQLYEQVVAPGEQVCVIGRFSAEKGGVIPDFTGGSVVQLVRGDPGSVAGSLWWKTARSIVAGILIAALGNYALFAYVKTIGSKSPIAVARAIARKPLEPVELHRAVKVSDRAAMGSLLQQGMSVDARDEDGRTALAIAPDARTAKWLIDHGADVNAVDSHGETVLMKHASGGNVAIVTLLIESGAKLDPVSGMSKSTALTEALDNEKLDVADILRRAGARDETVTEKNGKAVRADSSLAQICLDYLDAMKREDRAMLAKLSTFGTFEHADFKTLKESRPIRAWLVDGFSNGGAATVMIRGECADGKYRTHTFQLAQRDGNWRITGERWETRLDSKQP